MLFFLFIFILTCGKPNPNVCYSFVYIILAYFDLCEREKTTGGIEDHS